MRFTSLFRFHDGTRATEVSTDGRLFKCRSSKTSNFWIDLDEYFSFVQNELPIEGSPGRWIMLWRDAVGMAEGLQRELDR